MLRFSHLVTLVFALVLSAAVAASAANRAQVKAALQVTMQQHIDRSLVDGVYLHLDRSTGEVVKLYPTSVHPVIMRMGAYFVLCADFRNHHGAAVNIDFYMAQAERRYVVFHTAVDQRDMLERWMKAGKIERLD